MNDQGIEAELGKIEAPASMDCWEEFMNFAGAQIESNVHDQSRAYKLRLAFEELISNIIRASAEFTSSNNLKPVTLKVATLKKSDSSHDYFIIRTEDDGPMFDPKFGERESVDTDQPVHERQIGGLGLFLIQQSVDLVSYKWLNGKNTYELSTLNHPNPQ